MARSLLRMGLLGSLMALAAAPGASAKDLPQPADLYTTRVIVTGSDTRNRAAGFQLCLDDVLVKVSGDLGLLSDPRVPELGRTAGTLIDRYGYVDRLADKPLHDEQGTNDRPFYLTCAFNQAKIDGVLATLGRKSWLGHRPSITMLLAVRGFRGNSLLSSDGDFDPDMRISLSNTAARYGVSVTLPSLSALAANQVTVETVTTAPPDRLSTVVHRSLGDLPLVGTLDWSDADHGWVATWRLADAKGTSHRWVIKGVNYDEAFRNAVRGLALVLSGTGEP